MGFLDGYYESSLYGHTGGPQTFPSGPSAQRYDPVRRVASDALATPVRTDVASQEAANWQYNQDLIQRGSAEAKFVIQDAPWYRNQMRKMVVDGDVDGLARLTGEVDEFVKSHPGLYKWRGLRHNGQHGREIDELLEPMLNGGYKVDPVWLGTSARDSRTGVVAPLGTGPSAGATVQSVLAQRDPEQLASRANNIASQQSLDTDVARAMIDPSHEKYGLYHEFADISSPLPDNANPKQRAERDTRRRLLSNVIGLDRDYGGLFESSRDMHNFVSAAEEEFTGKDHDRVNVIGRETLGDLAQGYVAARARGQSASDYMYDVSSMKDAIMSLYRPPGTAKGMGPQDGRSSLEARAHEHEAMSYAMAAVRAMNKLNVAGKIGMKTVRDAVVEAADQVGKASSIFGLDLRLGPQEKLSDRVANMALSRLGVSGADDQGLGRFLADATGRLELLLSRPTVDAVRVALGKRGEPVIEEGAQPNPYLDTELKMLKAAGRILYSLSFDESGAYVGVSRALERLQDEKTVTGGAVDQMKSAISGALRERLASPTLADHVAGDLVGNLLGQAGATPAGSIEGSLNKYAMYFDRRVDPATGNIYYRSSLPDSVTVKSGNFAYDDGEVRGLLDGNLIATKKGPADKDVRRWQQEAGAGLVRSQMNKEHLADSELPRSRQYWGAVGNLCNWWTNQGKHNGQGPDYKGKPPTDLLDGVRGGYYAKWMHWNNSAWVKLDAPEKQAIELMDNAMAAKLKARESTAQVAKFAPEDGDLLVQYCFRPDTRMGVTKWIDDPRTGFGWDLKGRGARAAGGTLNGPQVMLALMMHKRVPSVSVKTWTTMFLDADTASKKLDLLTQYAPEVLNDSRILASGLVSRGKDKWELTPKKMLARMQEQSYGDSSNDVRAGTPKATESDSVSTQENVQLMEDARRALTTFGGSDLFFQKALARVKDHTYESGMPAETRADYIAAVSSHLAAAQRNQGIHGLEKATQAFLARRHRYFPSVDAARNAPRSERFIPAKTLMSDEEAAYEKERIKAEYKRLRGNNEEMPDEWFAEADAYGATQHRQYLQTREIQAEAEAKHRARTMEEQASIPQ